MKSLLNPPDLQHLQLRINNLEISSARRWGTMTVEEMLTHCIRQIQLATGEIKAPAQGPGVLHTALGKWISLSAIPWPKGLPTPKEMNMKKQGITLDAFEVVRNQLLEYLNKATSEPSLTAHPFFGNLSREEWGRLIYKHLDHHLKQFGQ
ncbi:MAG: DUF1569 domain-containing protein [Bacteroidetes bacterium]|nr:DUF1569 domain-containing protein [Bacteroidota bacterium]